MSGISLRTDRRFFVGVDSDGCALDTMERKHREVFIPQAIASLGLDGVAAAYRRTAEQVNLYSELRGANRFEALATCLTRLRRDRRMRRLVPDPAPIWRFVYSGRALSHASFAAYIGSDPPELLQRVLHWSAVSDRRIAAELRDPRPFPFVAECLARLHADATVVVVSATPTAALERDWHACGLREHVDMIAGQELGPKHRQLEAARAAGATARGSLMIGDAPGDGEAARSAGMLFFPIVPGDEEASWRELLHTGINRFLSQTFAGAYEERRLRYFRTTLHHRRPPAGGR
jgi:phosphoglycolate phosphatase-like HAD superfamily hydrolase